MRLIGADPTGVPIVHPLRWPGSWNVKNAPRMARIVALNEGAELHLQEALALLQDTLEAAGMADAGTGPAVSGEPQTHPRLIAAWMATIPNPDKDVHYNDWIKLGYACWNSMGGDPGFEVWDAWSRKSDKFNASEQDAGWKRIKAACTGPKPPRTVGAGTICFLAKSAGWKWTAEAMRWKEQWEQQHCTEDADANTDAPPDSTSTDAPAGNWTDEIPNDEFPTDPSASADLDSKPWRTPFERARVHRPQSHRGGPPDAASPERGLLRLAAKPLRGAGTGGNAGAALSVS